MKLLHVSLKSVYPKIDGGCVAIDNFMQLLASSFGELDHITISTPKHPFNEEVYRAELPNGINLIGNFSIDTSIHFFPLLKSLFSSKSYQVQRFYSKELAAFLQANASNYDGVILESAFLTPYLPILKGKTKVFIRTHNVESEIWSRKAALTKNFLKKWTFQKFSQQLRAVEKTNYEKVDGLIHISSNDEQFFRTEIPSVQQITIPLAIQESDCLSSNEIGLRFGFLGASNWQPNQEAVHRLVQNIFPSIHAKWENATFFVAGLGWENHSLPSFITNLGTLENTQDFYDKVDIILVPLVSGSGLKIKTVEGICRGKIVIGSTIAFEGLSFLSSLHSAMTKEEYVAIIDSILNNSEAEKEQILRQQQEILATFGLNSLKEKLIHFVTER